jgi:glycosyltransferase involved in cell wall biosynthesis
VVSVVIPTRARPYLIGRAVRSALAQSFHDLEVVVVLDGRDEATTAALTAIADPRVRVTILEVPAGAAGARNAGVREARAPWVAFLDDDDEWLPTKIEIQMRVARASQLRWPIVSCRLMACRGSTTFVWPRRTPRAGEHISEYLFCRSSPFWGEGDINTNTLLTRRELLEAIPFQAGLRRYIENDWVLRAILVEGTGIEFDDSQQPLAIWHMDDDRPRLTNSADWQESLAWIRQNRGLVTKRAYAGFVLADAGVIAARRNQPAAVLSLVREAFAFGHPRVFDLGVLAANWMIPERLRDWLAHRRAGVS